MSYDPIYLSKVLQGPIISEKSTLVAEQNRQFVFKVIPDASKREIKESVELLFQVEVDSVRVLTTKGKEKRFGRSMGKRSDQKKAYVKLKAGHDIDFSAA